LSLAGPDAEEGDVIKSEGMESTEPEEEEKAIVEAEVSEDEDDEDKKPSTSIPATNPLANLPKEKLDMIMKVGFLYYCVGLFSCDSCFGNFWS
jgi:hypothetical protein